MPERPSRSALIVGAACLVAVILKLNFLDSPGPWIFGDELLYRIYAQRIHDGLGYALEIHDPAYPPLYPLLLSQGFKAADWYRAMIALNILAGLATPPLVYAITRWFAQRSTATTAAVVAAFVPSGVVLTPLLLAENLSIPAFLAAVWATLRPRPYSNVAAFGAGAAMAAAYMVKYVLLIYIGPLILGFFLMQWIVTQEARWSRVFVRCAFVGFGFAASLLPWLAYAHFSGLSMKEALGFGGSVLPPFLTPDTIDGIWLYLTAFLAAAILATAPLNGLLAAYSPDRATERVYVTVLLISAAILIAFNTWLCWKASFTLKEIFNYLTQRYLIYLTWLAVPLAFVSAERLRAGIPPRKRTIAIMGAVITFLASLILLVGVVWSILPSRINVNSPDLWAYAFAINNYHVAPWLIGIIVAASAAVPLLWTKRDPVIVAGLCAVIVYGALDLVATRALAQGEGMAKITRYTTSILRAWGATGDRTVLVIDQKSVPYSLEFYTSEMLFWMADPPVVVSGSLDATEPGVRKIAYEWPARRPGYWKWVDMPSTPVTSVVLFSFGSPPPDAEPVNLTGVPGTSFFLLRVKPEEALRQSPGSAKP